MRIGELSRRSGVSARMLRYYEQKGLLHPVRRESGYREYRAADVVLATRIRTLSEAGMTLAAIRKISPCMDGQTLFRPCPEVRKTLNAELEKIRHKMAALQQSGEILSQYLGKLSQE
ncbi:MerR family transcriptional regulator [Affinibrenneria salicis]|uniref:MerR family transcriptional regulator n=1 Tax=Affinibrenneria salicis TaxID=2590031 RepID=A0A5J5FVS4_9GAMM|nr:MerR family transcriptional regulator [Affinibrenneria salicis]KAA8997340.1 MerR family transcriptional regulator [Affinibrenneria salicis]